MYHRIVVPLDGSSVAEKAVPYALELCRLSGGTLTLVRVVPSATQPPALYSMTNVEAWLNRQRQMRVEAELYLAEVVDRLKLVKVDPQCLVIAGDVEKSLLTLTEQELFDVLVMATRERRDPVRWMLGSVADYLVQRVPIPLLLVRQSEVE